MDHQFDVWHLAKSVTKKLTEKAKKKDRGDLFPWIKSVSNHLWWCADTFNGDKELLREKWISIVHHTANIHHCDSADYYHECPHPPIPRNVARTKRWLRPGSPAHEALKEVVFDKNLLKDIQQLTLSCHTGSLEVYHSVQTKYLPKRQHFWCKGMVPRTQLAALDHNANTSRDHATASRGENKGELRFKVVFPKRRSGLQNQLWRRQQGIMYAHWWMQLLTESANMLLKEVPLSQHHIFNATLLAPLNQIRHMLLQGTHLDFQILE